MSLRRSSRAPMPKNQFTIENPPQKRRKLAPPTFSPTVPEVTVAPPPAARQPAVKTTRDFYNTYVTPPTLSMDPSREMTVKEMLAKSFKNTHSSYYAVPRTTYSDQSLDTVIAQGPDPAQVPKFEKLHDLGANITVKELLAKNFKHYRVRNSVTSERATEIVNRTLTEKEVPEGVFLSGPPTIPSSVKLETVYKRRSPPQNLQQSLEVIPKQEPLGLPGPSTSLHAPQDSTNLLNAMDSIATNPPAESKSEAEQGLDEFAQQILTSTQYQARVDPPDTTAYPGNHLPFAQFWKKVPNYTQGDIHCFVDGVCYTPMSEIIRSGNFTVPMDWPVVFSYMDQLHNITLEEFITANGINLCESQHYRMLQGLLQKAGVHLRKDYAERLLRKQMSLDMGLQIDQDVQQPIHLTPETLPFICIYPDVYIKQLGRRIHGAVLVDTSADPLPEKNFLTTVYSEPLPLDSRRQILILHDALQVPVRQIAAQFGSTVKSVQETIGTRLLIDRHVISQHLLEESGIMPSNTMQVPKNKIRRTHYVDLNKLVWKHFKECQAAGVQINGKHLKDQAMRYAREMGLESFRGSEGWLDAFKRRHHIDLKTMTGFPVCYENDMYDEVEKECQDLIDSGLPPPPSHPSMSHHGHHQNHHLQNHSQHPLNHNYGSSAPDEFAASFFTSFPKFPNQMTFDDTSSTSSTPLQNMINSMMAESKPRIGMDSQNPDTILNVMKSCQIKVADKEVSHALDTIRTWILANDPQAMGLLVPLQERLSATSAGIVVNSSSEISTPSSSSS